MKLILMRHGEANSNLNDFDRTLTQNGRLQVTRMGDFISNTGWQITDIRHSPLVRAKQTADALLFGFGTQTPKLIEDTLLAPGFGSQDAMDLLQNYLPTDVAIWVFHMPDISEVVSSFLDSSHGLFYIAPGTSIALNINPQNLQSPAMIWSLPAEFL